MKKLGFSEDFLEKHSKKTNKFFKNKLKYVIIIGIIKYIVIITSVIMSCVFIYNKFFNR